jgi:hypothetical protein
MDGHGEREGKTIDTTNDTSNFALRLIATEKRKALPERGFS